MPSYRTRTRAAEKRKITASEDDAISLDSDNLDAEDSSPPKRQRKKVKKSRRDDDDSEHLDLKDGQEVVGVVVQAPKTGRGPFSLSRTPLGNEFLTRRAASPTGSSLAKHARFPHVSPGPSMQRPRMVWCTMQLHLHPLTSERRVRFKLHGRPGRAAVRIHHSNCT